MGAWSSSKSSGQACARRSFEDLEALESIAEFIDTHTEVGKRYEFSNMLTDLRQSLLHGTRF